MARFGGAFDARLRGLMSLYVAPVLVPTARVTAVTIDSAFWSLTPNRTEHACDFALRQMVVVKNAFPSSH